MNLDLLSIASLQVAIACATVWLICRLFPRISATWRCWLWRLVGIKCLASLLLVTIPIPVDRTAVPGPAALMLASGAPPIQKAVPDSINVSLKPFEPKTTPQTWRKNPQIRAGDLLVGLSALWWIGFGLLTFRVLRAFGNVRRVLKASYAHPAADNVLAPVQASAGYGHTVRIRIAPGLGAPAVVGLRHPTILLPETSLHTDETVLKSAIAHELAHIRRNDLAWVLAGEVCRAIFWFHPLVWLACREQHAEAEIAADKLARQWTETSPREYGRHLLTWLDRPSILTQSPGLMLSTHELGRRLKAMSLNPYHRSSSVAIGALLSIPLAAALAPIRFQAKSTSAGNAQIVNIPAAKGTMEQLIQQVAPTTGEAAERAEGDFQWKSEGIRKRGLARIEARGTEGKIYSAPLDGGGKVELLGLTHPEAGKFTSWSADGTRLPFVLPVVRTHSWQPQYMTVIGPDHSEKEVDLHLAFGRQALIRVSPGYRGINGGFLDPASGRAIASGMSNTMPVGVTRKKDVLLGIEQSFPKELTHADLSLWYYKPAKQLGTVHVENGNAQGQPNLPAVKIIPYKEIGIYFPQTLMSDTRQYSKLPDFFVSMPRPQDPRDSYRIGIFLKNGKTLTTYYVSPSDLLEQPKTPKRSFFAAKGAKPQDVSEIRIYITRQEQVLFKNVQLHPVK